MKISAIVCTHNRSQMLEKALKSLMEQSIPSENYEIIVIDNGSGESAREITYSMMEKALNLRYVYESELGLSHARNRGINEANGEIVAFMDDDAIADVKWLEALVDTFNCVKPQPICVGGKIQPIWESPKPSWLPDSELGIFPILDWGEQGIWLTWGEKYLVGANIAFKKQELFGLGGFKTNLGRRGNSLLANEEALVRYLIIQKYGEKSIYYQPGAVVRHLIPAYRLSKCYLFQRCYWQGASNSIMDLIISRTSLVDKGYKCEQNRVWEYSDLGFVRKLLKSLLRVFKHAIQAMLALDRQKYTGHWMVVASSLGVVIEPIKYFLGVSKFNRRY